VEGTKKAHENGEAMGFVGVRLTVMLGQDAKQRFTFCLQSLDIFVVWICIIAGISIFWF
jgi:hypothetical protein